MSFAITDLDRVVPWCHTPTAADLRRSTRRSRKGRGMPAWERGPAATDLPEPAAAEGVKGEGREGGRCGLPGRPRTE